MLLGFSSVDRFSIPVEMFPDRFISADRILSGSLPDIDTNVANEEIFWEAQTEVLGEWRSAPMIAYGTLRRLSAWKMYCRANDVPYETANNIAEQLKRFENDLRYAEEDEREAIDVHDYVPHEYHALIDMSEKYLGVIDSISPHPCAHLLCQNDIRREIGIIRINGKGTKKRTVYAAFIDGATAEAFGYLKNDILHVDVVKVNRESFERAGLEQPSVGELLRLTTNDCETWRMYADGLTLGINQVEQSKTREKVMQYKPRNITELSSFVATGFQIHAAHLLGTAALRLRYSRVGQTGANPRDDLQLHHFSGADYEDSPECRLHRAGLLCGDQGDIEKES